MEQRVRPPSGEMVKRSRPRYKPSTSPLAKLYASERSPYLSDVDWMHIRYQKEQLEKKRIKELLENNMGDDTNGAKVARNRLRLSKVPEDLYQRLSTKTNVKSTPLSPEEFITSWKRERWPQNKQHINGGWQVGRQFGGDQKSPKETDISIEFDMTIATEVAASYNERRFKDQTKVSPPKNYSNEGFDYNIDLTNEEIAAIHRIRNLLDGVINNFDKKYEYSHQNGEENNPKEPSLEPQDISFRVSSSNFVQRFCENNANTNDSYSPFPSQSEQLNQAHGRAQQQYREDSYLPNIYDNAARDQSNLVVAESKVRGSSAPSSSSAKQAKSYKLTTSKLPSLKLFPSISFNADTPAVAEEKNLSKKSEIVLEETSYASSFEPPPKPTITLEYSTEFDETEEQRIIKNLHKELQAPVLSAVLIKGDEVMRSLCESFTASRCSDKGDFDEFASYQLRKEHENEQEQTKDISQTNKKPADSGPSCIGLELDTPCLDLSNNISMPIQVYEAANQPRESALPNATIVDRSALLADSHGEEFPKRENSTVASSAPAAAGRRALLADLNSGIASVKLKKVEKVISPPSVNTEKINKDIHDGESFQQFLDLMARLNVTKYIPSDLSHCASLGRGKFAAVYSGSLMNRYSNNSNAAACKIMIRTIFNFSSDVNLPEEEENVIQALKIAQYQSNGKQSSSVAKTSEAYGSNDGTNSSKTAKGTGTPPEAIIKEFEREISALKALNPHRNIVTMLGFMSDPFGIVLELVPGSNLYEKLSNAPDLVLKDRVRIIRDVAAGLKYMHSARYMHRDIKPHNILVEERDGQIICAKVADLGTAIKLPFSPYSSIADTIGKMVFEPVGTSGYTAPEVLCPAEKGYSYPADVFSFSILMWETFTNASSNCYENPLKGLVAEDAYSKMKQEHLRPPLRDDCHTSDFQQLLNSSWSFDPLSRPSMRDISRSLNDQAISNLFPAIL